MNVLYSYGRWEVGDIFLIHLELPIKTFEA